MGLDESRNRRPPVDSIDTERVDHLLDRFAEAWQESGYEDDERSDAWGSEFWESWKWEFLEEFRSATANIDLTDLTPATLEDVIEAYDTAVGISTCPPAYHVGGRFGKEGWKSIREVCLDQSEEAANVLSVLFDLDQDLTDRLQSFSSFFEPQVVAGEDMSQGPLLTIATTLLSYAYPERYFIYKYSTMENFTRWFSSDDGDFERGYSVSQYIALNDFSKELQSELANSIDDASMLHVQTLYWVWNKLHEQAEEVDKASGIDLDQGDVWYIGKSENWDTCRRDGVITCGWGAIRQDLRGKVDEIEQLFLDADEEAEERRDLQNRIDTMEKFVGEMRAGDIVVAKSGMGDSSRAHAVGFINSGYYYDDDSEYTNNNNNHHFRRVDWVYDADDLFGQAVDTDQVSFAQGTIGATINDEYPGLREQLIRYAYADGYEVEDSFEALEGRVRKASRLEWNHEDYLEEGVDPPKVFIEKTDRSKEYRRQGPLTVGTALYSPSIDKGGNRMWETMREPEVGDIVLHLLQDDKEIAAASRVASSLETDFPGLPEQDWTDEQRETGGYRRWLGDYRAFDSPLDLYEDVFEVSSFSDQLDEIRQENTVFYTRNLGLRQGAYFTQCPDALLHVFAEAASEEFRQTLHELGRSVEAGFSMEAVEEYGSVEEAIDDVRTRFREHPTVQNEVMSQLATSVLKDWTEHISGIRTRDHTVEDAVRYEQIRDFYTEHADYYERLSEKLGTGRLDQVDPPETLFAIALRIAQESIDHPFDDNFSHVPIKAILNDELDLPQTGESGEEIEEDFSSPKHQSHPLVQHAFDADPDFYAFTAPPDYWPTVVRRAALGFGSGEKGQGTWDDIDEGDIVFFHAREEPSTDIETSGPGLVGAGIARAHTEKEASDEWWIDETGDEEDRRTVTDLLTFKYLALTGNPGALELADSVGDQNTSKLQSDVEKLLGDCATFDEINSRCEAIHPDDDGFPRQGVIGEMDDPAPGRGHVIADTLAPKLTPVATATLVESPDIDLPTDILEELVFLDDEIESTDEDAIEAGRRAILDQIEAALAAEKNIILTGPPGTGKTEIAEAVTDHLSTEYPRYFAGEHLTTATADWSTFDTVGGYMPETGTESDERTDEQRKSGNETLSFAPGVVLNRWRNRQYGCPTNQSLVIDEINRADIDKAFGQLFTTLSGQAVTLPYTTSDDREIELLNATSQETLPAGHQYAIPEAWQLFATMNTFDKASLYDMSYAFMRRFAFVRIGIPDLEETFDTTETRANLVGAYLDAWEIETDEEARELLGAIWHATNETIENRAIGPAIIQDIAAHLEGGGSHEPKQVAQAVISYIFPQLEGTPRQERKQIVREIADLEGVADVQIEAAAQDMLGLGDLDSDG